MNDQERSRFVANIEWFNGFFDGLRQLYKIIVDMLMPEFFPEDFELTSGNFYFPRQNYSPTIPPYYVLMAGGKKFALQILAVFDQDLFNSRGFFVAKPSIIVVVHSRVEQAGRISDYGLRVIENRGIEVSQQADSKVRGRINAKLPADFFSFQVPFDTFSADQNTQEAVHESIVGPIIEFLKESRTSPVK